ncbi:unnamed protein product [Clonostachys rhizophaga]|uniref:Uncharacterized protein n=1 Tax=Clonostachys rhizophaga TaxID=160324 RepID=A0A9N9VWQ8_9HYPO|nr:unnamed protein product [Clonostachys rhizophaga]
MAAEVNIFTVTTAAIKIAGGEPVESVELPANADIIDIATSDSGASGYETGTSEREASPDEAMNTEASPDEAIMAHASPSEAATDRPNDEYLDNIAASITITFPPAAGLRAITIENAHE